MEYIIGFLISLAISWAVAHYLGRASQLGFGGTLVVSLLFSPIIGAIAALLLRRR